MTEQKDSGISVSVNTHESNSFDSCEFIAYSIYRLWNPRTLIDDTNNTLVFTIYPIPSNPIKTFSGIVSPIGTESWYIPFVSQVYHLLKQSNLPIPLILIGLHFIGQVRRKIKKLQSNQYPLLYQLLVGSLMISQKQNSDARYSNQVWSDITGYSLIEINRIEMYLLISIEYRVHMNQKKYENWSYLIQTLGKEHSLILKAIAMSDSDYTNLLQTKLSFRADLIHEINVLRRPKLRKKFSIFNLFHQN